MKMLNTMCLNCKKLNNGCKGTKNQLWSGCIYKEVDDSVKVVDKVKELVKTDLSQYSYIDLDWVDDIVAVAGGGKVMIKEKISGEYTGKLTEIYL